MRVFGSIEPLRECIRILGFLYSIIFQPYQSFEPLAPLLGDIDKCTHGLFLVKIQLRTTIILRIFSM